ncbi:MAG: alpha/beta hydrolase [Gammaproteobacteria bacterium]
MARARANGIDIEYDEFGSPDDPAILLIMGLGMQLIAWREPFCRMLADRGYRVIRYDNRDTGHSSRFGHLRTPAIPTVVFRGLLGMRQKVAYTLSDMALDAVGLLDALGVERAHMVGVSMGGMIGQILAAKHADRVHTLTSIMSTSGHRSLPRPRREIRRHIFQARPADAARDEVVEHTVRTIELIGSPRYPTDTATIRAHAEEAYRRAYYPEGILRHVGAIVADGSRRERLRAIRCPSLVIHGTDDPLVPVEGGMDTAEYIPGARLELIPGMGHNLPEGLYETLVDLIAGHARSAMPPDRVANRISNRG